MRIDMRRYAALAHAEQRDTMMKDLAPVLEGLRVLRNRVLIATFHESEKTSGGLWKPDAKLDEGKYQGKAGLVLKCGPLAFEFEEVIDEVGRGMSVAEARDLHNIPSVGDWVFFRASDTWDCGIAVEPGNGVHCRFVFDDAIVGRISDPMMIY